MSELSQTERSELRAELEFYGLASATEKFGTIAIRMKYKLVYYLTETRTHHLFVISHAVWQAILCSRVRRPRLLFHFG